MNEKMDIRRKREKKKKKRREEERGKAAKRGRLSQQRGSAVPFPYYVIIYMELSIE